MIRLLKIRIKLTNKEYLIFSKEGTKIKSNTVRFQVPAYRRDVSVLLCLFFFSNIKIKAHFSLCVAL